MLERQSFEPEVHVGTDREREQERAGADAAAEDESDRESRHLDDRAYGTDGVAAGGQRRHEPVAWSRTHTGADVEARARTEQEGADEEKGDPYTGRRIVGQH